MPLFQEVFKDSNWKGKGLMMLAVDIGEERAKVQEFVKANNYSFPVALDITQSVARNYNIRSIPTTFFIDRNGIIREIKIGAFSSKSEIERALSKIT